jgi:hypothetical protein
MRRKKPSPRQEANEDAIANRFFKGASKCDRLVGRARKETCRMIIKNIAFVGIPVTDMKRAREFYEGVLNLRPDPEMTGERWTEYPIGEGTLAIACIGDQWKPSNEGTSAALEVENLEKAIARLEEKDWLR